MTLPACPAPLFPRLGLFLDPCPRSAPDNMAADEALLRAALPHPVLRLYAWRDPSFSFGYFLPWHSLAPFLPPGVTPVRRWTGGGLVDHRQDLTYSLVIPSSCPEARTPAPALYEAIHLRLAAALRELGIPCSLAPEALAPPHAADCCFAGGHARHDLLSPTGKIAGAAQRRHRLGLLHQGSIAAPLAAPTLAPPIASLLSHHSFPYLPPPEFAPTLLHLSASRYATPDWLHLR